MLIKMLLLALVVPAILLAACGDDDDDGGGDNGGASTSAPAESGGTGGGTESVAITAADFSFDPAEITVTEGEEVTINFTNDGSAEHSFTIGDEDVVEAEGGESADGTFTATADMTEFHCKYHPDTMKGTITVEGGSAQNIDNSSTVPTAAQGLGAGGYSY